MSRNPEFLHTPATGTHLTVEEVSRYRAQLDRFVSRSLPLSDLGIARVLLAGLDRPAFRTPFQQESSLPRFRAAIAEAISAIHTGKMPGGAQLPSKNDVRDPTMRAALDDVVQRLVALGGAFDNLLKESEIRPCGCQDPDCPVHMLSDRAPREMGHRRHELLCAARAVDPRFPERFYDMGRCSPTPVGRRKTVQVGRRLAVRPPLRSRTSRRPGRSRSRHRRRGCPSASASRSRGRSRSATSPASSNCASDGRRRRR